MSTEGITTKLFISRLKSKVRSLGGVTATAKKWGIPYQRITNAIAGNALPSKTILKKMGYEHVKTINYRYRKVK